MKLRQKIKIVKNFMRFMVTWENGTFILVQNCRENKNLYGVRLIYSVRQYRQAIKGFKPEVIEYIRKCQDEYYKEIKIVNKRKEE